MRKFWTMSDYGVATKGLRMARAMFPDRHWYVSNEGGPWRIECDCWIVSGTLKESKIEVDESCCGL